MSISQVIHPIPRHVIEIVLQYLSPPSVIPIPSHLLSTATRQRHHFLQLTLSDPENYFCWPSPKEPPNSRGKIIEILSTHSLDIAKTIEQQDLALNASYSADLEVLTAHVPFPCGIQLIFQHDAEDKGNPWKFHNASSSYSHPIPMTYPTIDLAMKAVAARLEATRSASFHDTDQDSQPPLHEVEAHDFWDGYDSSRPPSPLHILANASEAEADSEEKTEREYWARYSAVHGTADSTISTPLPEAQAEQSPSPHREAENDSATSILDEVTSVHQGPAHADIKSVLNGSMAAQPNTNVSDSDDAVEDIVRGAYRLWRCQNQGIGDAVFLSIVQRAIS